MTSETTRMAEAELSAEVDRLRAENDRLQWENERLQNLLLESVPKTWLTREQRLEIAVRQHLGDVPVVKDEDRLAARGML